MGDPDLSAPPRGAPILLNGRAATRPTITGVERWTAEVMPRLRDLDPRRYRIVSPRPSMRSPARGQAWEQLALPALAARRQAALILSPANLAPLLWPRNVLVLHDAAVVREPESFSRSYRAWHQTIGARGARRALKVITVSDFSRRELIDALGLAPEAVTVVPGGVSPAFLPSPDASAVMRKHGLSRPYVLTVATADRRKNLIALSEAAARLGERGIDLCHAGDRRPQFGRADSALPVRSLGYVPDGDLPSLYAGALAFVLPSRYEGFGLTCLEAMACGTPVVAAQRGALPETCGDAALLVDPDDRRELAEAVITAATDDRMRSRLRQAGLRRARGFTWERTAQQTDELLRELTPQPGIRPSP
jgi:glycosyltransferase involved in cell wall biosynthesis